ncbi:hypothetical protein PLESTB_000222300 [Pleodorina starrii]|uniref:MYND-type domain-containing protein n=1 Tax=Pleodorina starrii TaxID=330485 RepID=A0A9W6EXZ7_9CHLO|nr:hypothetical protein PLESTM_001548200 [Pleodorina starrii]GLC49468.1 hypothetical protein PLESTB_000222300 [Pleodorina starrii]GLC75705.1 hypothetical protein PLESTF_001675700 [Pleodorina starrii]
MASELGLQDRHWWWRFMGGSSSGSGAGGIMSTSGSHAGGSGAAGSSGAGGSGSSGAGSSGASSGGSGAGSSGAGGIGSSGAGSSGASSGGSGAGSSGASSGGSVAGSSGAGGSGGSGAGSSGASSGGSVAGSSGADGSSGSSGSGAGGSGGISRDSGDTDAGSICSTSSGVDSVFSERFGSSSDGGAGGDSNRNSGHVEDSSCGGTSSSSSSNNSSNSINSSNSSSSSDGGAAGSSGSSTRGNVDGSSRSGTSRSSDRAAGPWPLQPLQRLSLLTVFAASRWLPLLNLLIGKDMDSLEGATPHTAAFGPGAPLRLLSSCKLTMIWMQPLIHAYLHCRAAAASGQDGGRDDAAAAAAADTTTAAGEPVADCGPQQEAVDSWERLLLGRLGLPAQLMRAAQVIRMHFMDDVTDVASVGEALMELASALLHLLVAFPAQARFLLQSQMAPKVRLLTWLRRTLLQACHAHGGTPEIVRNVLELAPAIAAGEDPGAEDEARLRFVSGWAVRLGSLLPPPCLVATVLQQLPQCANPVCANLEGDSEAELRLETPCCGGCGGAVLYCSEECRTAHWWAEHLVECRRESAAGA